jgi:uncharacterized protein
MRILAISDPHGSEAMLAAIAAKAEEADLILLAGDLTDFGGELDARSLLAPLAHFFGKLVAVPGNCDKRGARDLFVELGISADGRLVEKPGALVIGSGGGNLHTRMTPYERRDDDLLEALLSGFAEARAKADAGEPLIALTHAPPKGSGADLRRKASVGSRGLAEALARIKPILWVCGHIHESPCVADVGGTLVLNPGPLCEGNYAWARVEAGAHRAEAELFKL